MTQYTNSLLNPVKNFLDNRNWNSDKWWQKNYGTNRPDWATDEVRTQDIVVTYQNPEYWKWLSTLKDEYKKREAEKYYIIMSALGRLENAIEDELIKRGSNPEVCRE